MFFFSELLEIKQQLEHSLGETEFLNKLQRARSLSESASETPSEKKSMSGRYFCIIPIRRVILNPLLKELPICHL